MDSQLHCVWVWEMREIETVFIWCLLGIWLCRDWTNTRTERTCLIMSRLIPSWEHYSGCYRMTNADWLISPWAAQILPGLSRERVRMAKIKETERVRIQSSPAFFVSHATRDASVCEKHVSPVISGDSGRHLPILPWNDWGTYVYLPCQEKRLMPRPQRRSSSPSKHSTVFQPTPATPSLSSTEPWCWTHSVLTEREGPWQAATLRNHFRHREGRQALQRKARPQNAWTRLSCLSPTPVFENARATLQ